jgi:hypothetical protein
MELIDILLLYDRRGNRKISERSGSDPKGRKWLSDVCTLSNGIHWIA